MIVVSNSSPLIAFARLNELSLLSKVFEQIVIPEAVWFEVRHEQKAGGRAFANASWLEVQPVRHPQRIAALQQMGLDWGEAEAIALAIERQADLLLIDERRGRRIAMQHGLKITGALGVLLIAKQKGLVSEIRPLLIRLRDDAVFRVSESLYRLVLDEAGEGI